MAQQHGLGRGLASLIPPRKDDTAKESPFKDMVLRAVEKESFPSAGVIKPMSSHDASPFDVSAPSGEPFVAQKVAPQSQYQDDVPVTPPPVAEPPVQPVAAPDPAPQVVARTAPQPLHQEGAAPEEPVDLSARIEEIAVGSIVPNPHQPRLQFDEAKLRELADSIREHGVLQPITVTKVRGGHYELIAGERRLQASRLAGRATIPVIVRTAEESEKFEWSIIENIQRHDLNPIEEAKAYARLADEFGLHQDAVAKKMGKSRSVVANTLRLLHLPVEIQRAIAEGKLSEGHAKALLGIDNPEKQRALFEMIMKTGMTVRETEAKAREVSVRPHVRHIATLPPELAEKSEQLSHILGTKVSLKPSGKGGRIVVEYFSDEELDGIFKKISGE